MNSDLAQSAGWSVSPGTHRGAAARGHVTRLPVPVSWDTPGALPCELAFGFLPHDGPWKRHRKADAEPPRGLVVSLATLRSRQASLAARCVTVVGSVNGRRGLNRRADRSRTSRRCADSHA